MQSDLEILTFRNIPERNESLKLLLRFLGDEDQSIRTVNVPESYSVAELYSFVQKTAHINDDFQLLHQGCVLDCNTNENILRCGLEQYSWLFVVPNLKGGMQIQVRNLEGKVYTLEVTPQESIHDIKQKIYDKSGEESSKQKLYYKAKLMENNMVLAEVLQDGCNVFNLVIRLRDVVQLDVSTAEDTVMIDADLNNSVYELKELIRDKTSVAVRSQILIADGKILVDTKPLNQYGLKNGDKVNLVVSKTNYIVYLVAASFVLLLVFEMVRLLWPARSTDAASGHDKP